ncbi:MAG: hypothetical protein ACXWXF_11895 [Aeromicrobium sp.]
MRFEPGQMNVPVGVPVTFILTNEGVIDHEFFLGDGHEQEHQEAEMLDSMRSMGHDEPGGASVEPGQTEELTLTPSSKLASSADCPCGSAGACTHIPTWRLAEVKRWVCNPIRRVHRPRTARSGSKAAPADEPAGQRVEGGMGPSAQASAKSGSVTQTTLSRVA